MPRPVGIATLSLSAAGMFDPGVSDWQERAACRHEDPELFFCGGDGANAKHNASSQPARDICNGTQDRPRCPVRDECLAYALHNGERFGVFGGTTPSQREATLRNWKARR